MLGDKPEITQQVCGDMPLQNGVNQNCDRISPKRKLVSRTLGLSRAPCTLFYQAHEASSVHSEEAGNQTNAILGRHAIDGKKQGTSKARSYSSGVSSGSWVHHKLEELPFSNTGVGFRLNSHTMNIALPAQKLHSLKMVRWMTDRGKTTIRDLACLVGTMVTAHPAILPAPLHYRHLERARSTALRRGGSSSAGCLGRA